MATARVVGDERPGPVACGLWLPVHVGLAPNRAMSLVLDYPITRRMLGVDLDRSRRIWPAQVGCPVGPDSSRRIQTDLDDHRDDQEASDTEPEDKASSSLRAQA
jgi:hypothetical protein